MEGFDSNYRYVLVTARRARQIQSGAKPLVETQSRKPCKIAQEEVQAGKVTYIVTETPKSAARGAGEFLDPSLGKA